MNKKTEMNKTLIVVLVVGLLLVGCVSTVFYNVVVDNYKDKGSLNLEEQIYQGPDPQGYDLEHFRKTGETIKEVSE